MLATRAEVKTESRFSPNLDRVKDGVQGGCENKPSFDGLRQLPAKNVRNVYIYIA